MLSSLPNRLSRRPQPVALRLLVLLLIVLPAQAQTPAELRSGVVKITSTAEGVRRTGTGFVVQTSGDAIYIATASHVVEGDKKPKVAFHAEPNSDVEAQVVKIESGDPKGLALLVVRNNVRRLLRDVRVLQFSSANDLAAGDAVTAIGFPQGGGGWAVVPATVASREGRDLVLSGNIAEGNSGGPIIKDGGVVGLVTGTQGQYARATPSVIVRFTMEGWGVKPGTAAATRTTPAQSPSTPTQQSTPAPAPSTRPPASTTTPATPPAPPPAAVGTGTVNGQYYGQLQGMTALQQTYTCGFGVVMAQVGTEVTGQYSNTCGDRGVFTGQVMGNALFGQTASQVNGGYCTLVIEVVQLGAALNGQYECLNGEQGLFSMNRK